MRTLLLFRGAPGAGKSTIIDRNGLRPYALSPDEIRLQCQSAQQTISGEVAISTNNESTVWNVLFELLEIRMQNGEFTVIDATNSKAEEMNRYKKLADHYRYRIFCVDLTSLPIEECKQRNSEREILKRVPEEVIDKMYARFRSQKIPSGISIIDETEINSIFLKQLDFSQYTKIVHIGDVHGCYSALMTYFEKVDINDLSTFYIFLGDYIDRGIENVEVMNFLFSIMNNKNVLLLEGNHERWIQAYGDMERAKSPEFELVTRRQFDNANLNKKKCRMLYRKLGQCAWYTYRGNDILVSHGGIASPVDNFTFLPTKQLIHGVGGYNDVEAISQTWMIKSAVNQYQIHGHRNTKGLPVRAEERVFNLEGDVEFGGHLRIVELTESGFNTIEIKNDIFKPREEIYPSTGSTEKSIRDVIMNMRADTRNILEKNFGHISSFNFSRDVFYHKDRWNSQTVRARGLYIDLDNMKVAARSFDKFFNVDEVSQTELATLKHSLQFPVTAYIKENGYLGLIAYDSYGDYEDSLLVTTKSDIKGDYAAWLREILNEQLSVETRHALSEYCKENDVTFVVEVIDPQRDPHIIEYKERGIYLLAVVKNELEFSQYDYEQVTSLAHEFGLRCKIKAREIDNWQEFFDWYNFVQSDSFLFEGKHIEGFVIEDSAGFMTKLKLPYYKFWKHMRSIAHKTLRNGYIADTGQLYDALSNDFYDYVKRLYSSVETKEERDKLPRDIITLRNMFYSTQ